MSLVGSTSSNKESICPLEYVENVPCQAKKSKASGYNDETRALIASSATNAKSARNIVFMRAYCITLRDSILAPFLLRHSKGLCLVTEPSHISLLTHTGSVSSNDFHEMHIARRACSL